MMRFMPFSPFQLAWQSWAGKFYNVRSSTNLPAALSPWTLVQGAIRVERALDKGIAVKHAHSGDNPEADWGRHVLQAARFGLQALNEAFPQQAPFTAANTRIIAFGHRIAALVDFAIQALGLFPRGGHRPIRPRGTSCDGAVAPGPHRLEA